VCPYHRRLLRQLCPHCESLIGPLDCRSRSGYCSRCGQSLVSTAAGSGAACETLSSNELMWATWVASSFGELLSTAPHVAFPPTREQLVETIGLCIRHISSGNASKFARLVHVGREDVSRWQRGKALPRLDLLLKIAYRLGASLPEFLLGCLTSIPFQGFLRSVPAVIESSAQRRTSQPRPRVNRAAVSQLLHAALAENPPPSLTPVMKRTTHTEVTVRRHFPEMCFEISKHYTEHRVRRAIARKTQAAEEVRRLAYELHAEGIALTHRNMRPLLTSSDYLNLEEGREALRLVRRDLGL
jgi:transcriptional regulator with XRE-family HTH domain